MTQPILLTGFQPFGDNAVNPTALLMERLAGEPGIVTAVLPVEYDACAEAFAALLEQHQPVAALCFGLAVRTDYIQIERLAWNRDESGQPDNAGVVREDAPIVPDGPTAYGSALPIPMLMRELAIAGLPVTFSDFAGGFVCNHLFYRARHLIETQGLDLPMGFIHLPPLPEQVADQPGRRGLPLDRQELAVRTLVGLLRHGMAESA
ncbi:pyroglutamyl-peptidase I family protein [Azospirillum sp. sgz302134]